MTVFEELTKGMKFSGPVEDIKKNMVKVFEKNFRCPPCYAGTGPSNLFEVLQAAGVSETLVARSDITQRSTKTIPLHLEREVKQYGDFQYT